MSIDAFLTELGNMPSSRDEARVQRKSRDMSLAFSPILKEEASDKFAEAIVQPQNKDDVIAVARAAARHKVPLICRGAGTCNFGQGIPLFGGAIVDLTKLNSVKWVKDRAMRMEAGARMLASDTEAQKTGQEMRMHPSTRRASTIGGYVGGGHVGIGSCTWGILKDRGNILGMEVVSIEEDPKIVEVRGADVNLVHHAYGANGIMTEVEMPLTNAYPWLEAIVSFDDFMRAARFGVTLNQSSGMVVKLVSVFAWPFQKWLKPLAKYFRDGEHTVHVMVAAEFRETFDWLVNDFRGTVTYAGLEGQGDFGFPLYETAFGHAGLHARREVPNLAGNLGLFPSDDLLGSIERIYEKFSYLGPLHYEMKRIDGVLTCQGSPNWPFQDSAHMAKVIAEMEAEGVRFANIHTLHVRENGMKPVDDRDLAFKQLMDPHGLSNPGKLTADDVTEKRSGAALPTSGWKYKRAG